MKNLKVTLLAALILCTGAFLVVSAQAENTAEAPVVVDVQQAVEPLVLEPANEMMSSKVQAQPIRPIEIEPKPLACGPDSHAACQGKNHGDSCGPDGLGTCNASYPTDECLCL